MKFESKKILVCPIAAVGHVNACIGLASPLLDRGHRVAFFVDKSFEGKLKAKGFEEFVYETPVSPEDENREFKNPGDWMATKLLEKGILGQKDPLIQLEKMFGKKMFSEEDQQKKTIAMHEALKKVIEDFDPDLFIVDDLRLDPAISFSGKPWIKNVSLVPLIFLKEFGYPPAWSGLSNHSDQKQWSHYQKLIDNFMQSSEYNDIVESLGFEKYPDGKHMPDTQALTVYAMPEEYEYPELRNMKNWFNIEVYNPNKKNDTTSLKELVPESLYEDDLNGKFSGKWIYLSMGSMGSADLNLMNRLLGILGKTDHKYIVSKGPRHQEYELPPNMWGDRYLPQTKIVPLVDLVLTHGGNNTVTETFAQGKPMIVFPLFCDQHDNGQRLDETGWGVKIPPYSFTEEQLLESIERLLNDEKLNSKLAKASRRILTSEKHEKLCDLIEDILKNEANSNVDGNAIKINGKET